MVSKRRIARKYALNMLYQAETRPDERFEKIAQAFWSMNQADPDVKRFANLLAFGTIQHLKEIDETIEKVCHRWEIQRMADIDRCILRFALFEMFYLIDIPHAVSINEAIEIAKEFSTEKSSAFINGILDKAKELAKEIPLEYMMTSGVKD